MPRSTIGLVLLALAGPAQAAPALVYAKLALVQSLCGQTTFAPCAPGFAFRTGIVLLPIQCLEEGCTHTPVTTELVSVKIRDDSGNPDAVVAAPGTVLAPLR